jgi:peptidoglycan hydrolase FlgJ
LLRHPAGQETYEGRLVAISPPSDIVLDVARAVEPAGVEAARAQLARRGGAVGGAAAFSLGDMRSSAAPEADQTKSPDTFKRFEAMVLETFIQNMLPKNAENVYGKGVAGDMWKSMLAGKLADAMAERGGIGISDRILGDHYVDGEKTLPVGPVSGGPDRAEADQQAMLSTALVQEMQRNVARSLSKDQADAAETKS